MEKNNYPRLFLTDDHIILRNSLRLYLEQNGYEIVGEAVNGQATLELVPKLKPDILLLDISLPDINGVDITKQLTNQMKNIKIIALTMHEESDYLIAFFEAGGMGYVHKSLAVEDLIKAVEMVLKGKYYLSEKGMQTLAKQHSGKKADSGISPEILSDREKEVFTFVARGYTCKEIADLLFLSSRTVETYRLRSMQKLGLKSRSELVDYAVKNHLF